jgi:signal transduction histidine kinase
MPSNTLSLSPERSAAARGGHVSRTERVSPRPALLALLVAAYFAAGKLGLSFALVHPSATPVWAPTGIALAALLSFGYRAWPAIFVAAFLVNVTTAGSVATSLGIAAGNTLEATIGAWLVNRFAGGWQAFDRAQDTFKFTLLAGVLTTAVSATIGVGSLVLGGAAPAAGARAIWLTWWLGDMGGCLVVTPFLLLWSHGEWRRWTRARALEAAAMMACLIAVGLAVFGSVLPPDLRFPLKFLCLPPLIWAAFRFDGRVASAAMLVLSSLAVWATVGAAQSGGGASLNESLALLQVFLAVAAVTTLALASLVEEQRRREETLRTTSQRLRAALAELEAFSHSISHDLRSPIGAVLNYAVIIEQDHGHGLDEETLRHMQRIRASGENAVHLLDQLALFIGVEREEGEMQSVDMEALARDAFADLSGTGSGPGDVEFRVARLPAARGTPALLQRVFTNLFSNAVKYTRGRERATIRVEGEEGSHENTYVVADNGSGFDPKLGATLYQPFHRLGSSSDGSGLGLAIVAKIVRRHGGRVWAESDGASGARFCFTLPSARNGG